MIIPARVTMILIYFIDEGSVLIAYCWRRPGKNINGGIIKDGTIEDGTIEDGLCREKGKLAERQGRKVTGLSGAPPYDRRTA